MEYIVCFLICEKVAGLLFLSLSSFLSMWDISALYTYVKYLGRVFS